MAVAIRKMTSEEFEMFYSWSVDHHAKELMEECRLTYEAAIMETKAEVAQMLPDGLDTAHNYLMTIENTDDREILGFIWTLHEMTEGKKQSFLCDFVILEAKRRQGYAAAALALMEKDAIATGCQESVLFVADNNLAASTLYKKSGYQVLRKKDYGQFMRKQL